MSLIKKIFFYFVIASINILLIEAASYAFLKYINYQKIENFNVWDFTERVNDERFITIKENYKYKHNENMSWSVETNDSRQRIPPNVENKKSPSDGLILFIGDSVPFGWGGPAENSMPYILQESLPNYEVINGAIPSYSLFQTTKRFEYEFKRLKNLKYIYIQIYDPVSQYAIFGSNWKENDNWYTYSDKKFNGCKFSDSRIYDWFYRKSNFIFLLNKIYRENTRCWLYSPPDSTSDERLFNHVMNSLKSLKENAPESSVIIVAPVTPSPSGLAKINNDHKQSLSKVNEALEATSNVLGLKFVNTIELLDRQEYFIDDCCHLSKSGAEKVVAEVLKNISKK